jgi:hypothetical protein
LQTLAYEGVAKLFAPIPPKFAQAVSFAEFDRIFVALALEKMPHRVESIAESQKNHLNLRIINESASKLVVKSNTKGQMGTVRSKCLRCINS